MGNVDECVSDGLVKTNFAYGDGDEEDDDDIVATVLLLLLPNKPKLSFVLAGASSNAGEVAGNGAIVLVKSNPLPLLLLASLLANILMPSPSGALGSRYVDLLLLDCPPPVVPAAPGDDVVRSALGLLAAKSPMDGKSVAPKKLFFPFRSDYDDDEEDDEEDEDDNEEEEEEEVFFLPFALFVFFFC